MMDNQEQTFRREYGAADGISVLYQNTDSFPKPEGCIYMVQSIPSEADGRVYTWLGSRNCYKTLRRVRFSMYVVLPPKKGR